MIGQAATRAPLHARSHAAARARKIAYQVMLYGGALLLTAYCVVPLVWMLLTSLKPPPEVITYPPAILPKEPTLRNFRLLFEESLILTFLKPRLLAHLLALESIVPPQSGTPPEPKRAPSGP